MYWSQDDAGQSLQRQAKEFGSSRATAADVDGGRSRDLEPPPDVQLHDDESSNRRGVRNVKLRSFVRAEKKTFLQKLNVFKC